MNQVNQTKRWLSNNHITVPDDWTQACVEWIQEENQGRNLPVDEINTLVYEQWLLSDLHELEVQCLPTDVHTAAKYELNGTYALQVDSILDVGLSFYSQQQKAKGTENSNSKVSADEPSYKPWEQKPTRMLMFKLTDGKQVIQGMEYRPISCLSPQTLPGTKVLIHGRVLCRYGVLMLNETNIKNLGGEVDTLVEANSILNSLQAAMEASAVLADKSHRQEYRGSAVRKNKPDIKQSFSAQGGQFSQSQGMPRQQPGTFPKKEVMSQRSTVYATTQPNNTNMNHQPSHQNGAEFDDDFMDDIDFDDDFEETYMQRSNNSSRSVNNNTQQTGASRNKTNQLQQGFPSNHISNQPHQGVLSKSRNNQPQQGSAIVKKRNSPLQETAVSFDRTSQAKQTCIQSDRNSVHTSSGYKTVPQSGSSRNSPGYGESGGRNLCVQNDRRNVPQGISKGQASSGNTLSVKNETCFARGSGFEDPDDVMDFEDDDLDLQAIEEVERKTDTVSRIGREESTNQTLKRESAVPSTSSPSYMTPDKIQKIKEEQHSVVKSQTPLDIESEYPFTYLCKILAGPVSSTPTYHTVKAYISTLTGKLSSLDNKWTLSCKINDGTRAVDVDLSTQVLTEMIGFSPQEAMEMKKRIPREPSVKQILKEGLQQCQQKLIELMCLMEIEVSSGSQRPVIVATKQLTSHNVEMLYQRVAANWNKLK